MENPCYSIQMVWAVLTKFIHSVSLKQTQNSTTRQCHSSYFYFCVGYGRGAKPKIQNRANTCVRHDRSHSSITISTVMWMEWIRQLCSLSGTESISAVCTAKHETSILLSLDWSSESFELTLSAFCARLCGTWKRPRQCAAGVCRLVL